MVGLYAASDGICFASANASITFISDQTLVKMLEQAGRKVMRGLNSRIMELDPLTASKSANASSQDMSERSQQSRLFPQDATQWMIDYADLSKTRVIGEGAFGKVYLGKWHETDVAIKALTSLGALGFSAGKIASHATESDVKDALKTLEREVALMVAMRHPNVILFMGVCPDPPCVVTEYCSRGSLYDLLKNADEDTIISRELTWHRRLGMLLDAAKGMLYLHSHKPPIIHRDLKSPNLLVDNNWRVKVTDFNLSRLSDAAMPVPGVASSVVASNPRWHAPEIIKDSHFSKAGDVYAFGLIMWEMITWKLPFEGMGSFQMILFIGEKAGRPLIPTTDDPDGIRGGSFAGYDAYVDLMNKCWAQNAEERPGFPEVISALRDIMGTVSSPGSQEDMTPGNAAAEDAVPSVNTWIQSSTTNTVEEPGTIAPRQVASPFDAPAAPGPIMSPFDSPSTNPSLQQAHPSPFDAPEVPSQARGTSNRNLIDSAMESSEGRLP